MKMNFEISVPSIMVSYLKGNCFFCEHKLFFIEDRQSSLKQRKVNRTLRQVFF
jgi:hypothetical protein